MKVFFGLYLGVFIILMMPLTTNAQSLPDFAAEGIRIDTAPETPEPFESVTVRVDTSVSGINNATFRWFIDGEPVASANNQRSFTYTASDVGEVNTIRLEVEEPNGRTHTHTKTISPVRLDLAIEADTTVPSFYRGRAVPSPGSTVRVVALPDTGSGARPEDFSYNWKLNNQPLYGGVVAGRNIASFSAPGFSAAADLSVDVFSPAGNPVASRVVRIPVQEPRLYFYEDNPLRGTSRIAVGNTFHLSSDETDVRVEPFFMNPDLITSGNAIVQWTINGSRVENPNTEEQVLTLRRRGARGSFTIGFQARHREHILHGAQKTFTLTF